MTNNKGIVGPFEWIHVLVVSDVYIKGGYYEGMVFDSLQHVLGLILKGNSRRMSIP